jgi:hypothetical protein
MIFSPTLLFIKRRIIINPIRESQVEHKVESQFHPGIVLPTS